MVIPCVQTVETRDGSYELDERTGITAAAGLTGVAVWLQGRLRPATGLPLPLQGAGGSIRLDLDERLGHEEYRLAVGLDGVQITGGDPAGVFYGGVTLLQLLPPQILRSSRVADTQWRVPAVRIQDAPRFGWRGMMLDVARHFLPKREVMRYIELLALHKLNTLHLHLTDDQGWRLQIQQYPRLTQVGGWRAESQVGAPVGSPTDGRPHGGYYTQDDIREIVAFATERFVEIVPEIEMPGHVQAAIAAYPQLGVGEPALPVATEWGIIPHVLNAEDSTVEFFTNVLDEVTELFPCRYIGIGGDECPTVQWEHDPRTQQLMRERGITTERGVQTWFTSRIGGHLERLGRRMVGWDELLEGDVPDSALMLSWRGMAGVSTAVRRGHDVVACPDDRMYLDYRESDSPQEPIPVASPLDLRRVLEFEPVPAGLRPAEAAHVVGGQANVWTEHMDSPRVIDFHVFPRLCAVAEALWRQEPRGYGDFHQRLTAHLRRLDALGVEYRPETGPHAWQQRPGVPGRPVTLQQRQRETDRLVAPTSH